MKLQDNQQTHGNPYLNRCRAYLPWVLILVLLLSALFALTLRAPAGIANDSISLTNWRAILSDSQEYATLEFDDSTWQNQNIPKNLWPKKHVWTTKNSHGWLRTNIFIPEEFKDTELMLYLGIIWQSVDIYLNGEHIDRHGWLTTTFDKDYAAGGLLPVRTTLPKPLINYGEANLIALRFQSGYDKLGPLAGPVYVGLANEINSRADRLTMQILSLELAWLLMGLGSIVLLLLVDYLLQKPWRHIWLIVGVIAATISLLSSTAAIGATQGWLIPGSYLTSFLYAWIGVACCFLYIMQMCQNYISRNAKTIAGLIVVYGVFEQWIMMTDQWYFYHLIIGLPLLFIVLCMMSYSLVCSWNRGAEERAVSLLLLFLGASLLMDYFMVDILPGVIGRDLTDWLLLLWMPLTLFVVLKACFTRLQESESLALELLHTQEKVQQRIANELHDGLGQQLTTMRWQIEAAAEVSTNPPDILPNLQSVITDLQGVCCNLRPTILKERGLHGALYWLKKEVEPLGTQLNIFIDPKIADKDSKITLQIFRVAQEAIRNAMRHGCASHIIIKLEPEGQRWLLFISDNGKGFSATNLAQLTGLGLTSMKERIRACGGKLVISSEIGHGCTIVATFPIL